MVAPVRDRLTKADHLVFAAEATWEVLRRLGVLNLAVNFRALLSAFLRVAAMGAPLVWC
jgi:hypothetical protein